MNTKEITKLKEDAQHHINFWAGTIWEKLLLRAIDTQDWDQLDRLIRESLDSMEDLEWSTN